LLENLGNMTDIIDTNFSQIKEILQQNKQEVINAITTEKNKDIAKLESELKDLRNDLKAKDERIIKLTLKEGELRGKDELIKSLNVIIEKLQQKLDALRDSHNHDNPLKSDVDSLTAKKLELEV
jgi:DNA repair exonuclease SbcCD ATPase subunit